MLSENKMLKENLEKDKHKKEYSNFLDIKEDIFARIKPIVENGSDKEKEQIGRVVDTFLEYLKGKKEARDLNDLKASLMERAEQEKEGLNRVQESFNKLAEIKEEIENKKKYKWEQTGLLKKFNLDKKDITDIRIIGNKFFVLADKLDFIPDIMSASIIEKKGYDRYGRVGIDKNNKTIEILNGQFASAHSSEWDENKRYYYAGLETEKNSIIFLSPKSQAAYEEAKKQFGLFSRSFIDKKNY